VRGGYHGNVINFEAAAAIHVCKGEPADLLMDVLNCHPDKRPFPNAVQGESLHTTPNDPALGRDCPNSGTVLGQVFAPPVDAGQQLAAHSLGDVNVWSQDFLDRSFSGHG
jgi:hypothetical protein